MSIIYSNTTAAGKGKPYNKTVPVASSNAEEKSISVVRKFQVLAKEDSTFTSKAKLLPDGMVELAWTSEVPAGSTVPPGGTLQLSSGPYSAWEGVKILLGDKELAFSPEGVSPGEHTLFEGEFSGRLTFMPDKPEKTFSLDIPEKTKIVVMERRFPEGKGGNPYEYSSAIRLYPTGNLKLLLDMRTTSAESLKASDVFAGINFWRNDRVHIPNFAASKNLFSNPSFEGGLRYWIEGSNEWTGEDWDAYAIDDTVAYKGKRSLRLKIKPTTTKSFLNTFAIPAVRGKKYTVSFYAKADKPGFLLDLRARTAKWGVFANLGDHKLTTEWQRYSGTFTCPNEGFMVALYPLMAEGIPADEAPTAWVDAFQIEQAERATDYAEPPVQVTLATAESGNYLKPGVPMKAALRIHTTEANGKGVVACEIKDFFYNKRFSESYPFTTDATGEAVIDLPLDGKLGTGIFIVKTEAKLDSGGTNRDFHRITIMEPAAGNSPNKAIFGTFVPRKRNFDPLVKRMAEIGFGSINYEFAKADMELLAKHGISNTGTGIVTHGLIHTDPETVAFMKRLLGEPYSDELRDKLEKFSYQMVKAYPWINTWFMSSETRLKFQIVKDGDDEGFAKYTLACRKGVKSADPSKTFLFDGGPDNMMPDSGIASTDRWLTQAGRIAPDVHFDGFGIHPYRMSPEEPDMDADNKTFLNMLARHGYKNEPIYWNEGSYYTPWNIPEWNLGITRGADHWRCGTPTYDMGWAERQSAAYFARGWLVTLKNSDRVKQLNGWCGGYIFLDADMENFALAKIPNTLSHLLGDAKFKKDIRFAVNCRSYTFEDAKGRPVVALWSHFHEADYGLVQSPVAKIDLQGMNLEFFDLMENRVVPEIDKAGVASLPVTPFPIFIRGEAGTLGKLTKALSGAMLVGSHEFPLEVDFRLKSRELMDLQFSNRISRAFKGSGSVASKPFDLELPETSSKSLDVTLAKPVSLDALGEFSIPVEVTEKGGETIHKDFTFTAFAIGKKNDEADFWAAVPWAKLPNWKSSGAPMDPKFKASFRTLWDEKNFYLQVKVDDATPGFPKDRVNPAMFYNYDSLQLYIDTLGNNARSENKGQSAFDNDNYSYMVSKLSESGKVIVYREAAPEQQLAGGVEAPKAKTVETSIDAKITDVPGGYIYDLTIPRHLVSPFELKEGSFARIALVVNDNDGKSRRGGLVSTTKPGSEPVSNPELWPCAILVK